METNALHTTLNFFEKYIGPIGIAVLLGLSCFISPAKATPFDIFEQNGEYQFWDNGSFTFHNHRPYFWSFSSSDPAVFKYREFGTGAWQTLDGDFSDLRVNGVYDRDLGLDHINLLNGSDFLARWVGDGLGDFTLDRSAYDFTDTSNLFVGRGYQTRSSRNHTYYTRGFDFTFGVDRPTAVPEPGTIVLMLVGIFGLLYIAERRANRG